MNRTVTISGIIATLFVSLTTHGAVLSHWDFNTFDGDQLKIPATAGSGQLTLAPGWTTETISNPKGTVRARVASAPAGTALSLIGEAGNGQWLQLTLPDTTASNARSLRMALRRSGTGFTTLNVSWSRDGGKTFVASPPCRVTERWGQHAVSWPPSDSKGPLMLRLQVDGATGARGALHLDNLAILDQVPDQLSEGEAPTP